MPRGCIGLSVSGVSRPSVCSGLATRPGGYPCIAWVSVHRWGPKGGCTVPSHPGCHRLAREFVGVAGVPFGIVTERCGVRWSHSDSSDELVVWRDTAEPEGQARRSQCCGFPQWHDRSHAPPPVTSLPWGDHAGWSRHLAEHQRKRSQPAGRWPVLAGYQLQHRPE